MAATNPHAFAYHAGLPVTLDTQFHDAAASAGRPPFLGPRDDVSEPPARVVEYVRLPQTARVDSRLPAPASVEAIRAHSRLPPWLFRLLLAWGVLTLASLVGPCRPVSPSPALAAEASP